MTTKTMPKSSGRAMRIANRRGSLSVEQFLARQRAKEVSSLKKSTLKSNQSRELSGPVLDTQKLTHKEQ